ncbi:MAG: PorT family protein [Ignavibacteria bacterium]|nr:PorT family protein [Ignavibacteria bacterium]
MRKLFLLSTIVTLALFITQLNAQVKIQIGPKAGINIASITGDDATFNGQTLDSKFGFGGGIFAMFQFGNIIAIQPEIYYSMKGATTTFNNIDVTFSLDYVEAAILLKAVIPVQGANIRPAVFVGPVLGFNTTAEVKGEGNGQSATEDISDEIQSTDFSLTFGGGIGFLIGMHEIGLDVRYILGLKSFDDTNANDDVKNSAINFNVYFGFSVL